MSRKQDCHNHISQQPGEGFVDHILNNALSMQFSDDLQVNFAILNSQNQFQSTLKLDWKCNHSAHVKDCKVFTLRISAFSDPPSLPLLLQL